MPWPASAPSRCWSSTSSIPEGTPGDAAGRAWCAPRRVPAKAAVDGPGHRPRDADRPGRRPSTSSPASSCSPAASPSPTTLQAPGHRRRCPTGLQEVSVLLEPQRAVGGRLAAGDTVGVFLSLARGRHGATHAVLHRVLVTQVQGAPAPADPDAEASRRTGRRPAAAPSAQPDGHPRRRRAGEAEAVVFGVEHGTLWLSLEPEGAEHRRHRRHRTRTTSTEGRPDEPRRSRRSRRGPDPPGQAGGRRRRRTSCRRAGCPAIRRGCSSSCSTASCPTSCSSARGASPDAVLTLAARLDIQTPGHQRRPHRRGLASRCGRPPCASGIRDLLPPVGERAGDPGRRSSGPSHGRDRPPPGAAPGQRDRALHRPGHHHRLAQGRGRQDHGRRPTWPSG